MEVMSLTAMLQAEVWQALTRHHPELPVMSRFETQQNVVDQSWTLLAAFEDDTFFVSWRVSPSDYPIADRFADEIERQYKLAHAPEPVEDFA